MDLSSSTFSLPGDRDCDLFLWRRCGDRDRWLRLFRAGTDPERDLRLSLFASRRGDGVEGLLSVLDERRCRECFLCRCSLLTLDRLFCRLEDRDLLLPISGLPKEHLCNQRSAVGLPETGDTIDDARKTSNIAHTSCRFTTDNNIKLAIGNTLINPHGANLFWHIPFAFQFGQQHNRSTKTDL